MSRVAARCPSCRSVFFVSAAQGKVANNLVRCGRCGHLFSVLENLSDSEPEPEIVASPSEPDIREFEIDVASEAEPAADESDRDIEEAPPLTETAMPAELKQPGGNASECSQTLDDARPSGFDLSNLATHLPQDFALENAATQKTAKGGLLSLAIILFALVGLGGQFVFFNLPTLSQHLEYRPWLQTFCAALPCELAAYSKPGLISVEHLQVRAHPHLEGSLMVELVLTNTASLEQAYPPLILRFDDLSGQQVAARRLSAKEYLPQALSAAQLMPVDKAVSIKLAILDPGERALSYSVSVEQ
ncbi:MAG: zinc-ribbon and DUF3426 domain-containing protein [Gammaproteobacteria bacterium]|nr:zinc-ribbon and DUF3426 domain-containing protein [Gammaproteobacteria bacterium]MBQ0840860.1 zinc-ribbon and DUF3426 domain-containing protein [Gammaproteobacteria bacterium]